MDITIKNIPEGAEDSVKALAAVAVERFLLKPLQPPKADVDTFQETVDSFLEANGLPKKFAVVEDPVEPIK